MVVKQQQQQTFVYVMSQILFHDFNHAVGLTQNIPLYFPLLVQSPFFPRSAP